MQTDYYSTSTTYVPCYDGTSAGDYSVYGDNGRTNIFYTQSQIENTLDDLKTVIQTELVLKRIHQINKLGRVSFYSKQQMPKIVLNRRPINLCRRILRCNRHGLGLRIRWNQ